MFTSNQNTSHLKLLLFALALAALVLIAAIIYSNNEPIISDTAQNSPTPPKEKYQGASYHSQKLGKEDVSDQKNKEVALSEITSVSDSDTAKNIHQKLAISLISELELLDGIRNRDTIRARLTPTANKFYLLQQAIRANQISHTNFSNLPSEYDQRVEALADLWNKNPDLAHEADFIYSQLNILNKEHVPYLLRHWLISYNTRHKL